MLHPGQRHAWGELEQVGKSESDDIFCLWLTGMKAKELIKGASFSFPCSNGKVKIWSPDHWFPNDMQINSIHLRSALEDHAFLEKLPWVKMIK